VPIRDPYKDCFEYGILVPVTGGVVNMRGKGGRQKMARKKKRLLQAVHNKERIGHKQMAIK